MSDVEKNRLIEIIFYSYFTNKSEKMIKNKGFWGFIKAFCELYELNYDIIARCLRILLDEKNSPTEIEMVYLLNKAGVTVRPMAKISKIYWQKQKKYLEELKIHPITVRHTIFDPVSKIQMKAFIQSFYDVSGIFSHMDEELIGL